MEESTGGERCLGLESGGGVREVSADVGIQTRVCSIRDKYSCDATERRGNNAKYVHSQ